MNSLDRFRLRRFVEMLMRDKCHVVETTTSTKSTTARSSLWKLPATATTDNHSPF